MRDRDVCESTNAYVYICLSSSNMKYTHTHMNTHTHINTHQLTTSFLHLHRDLHYHRKLSSAPRVKVSSNTATVRSGISPTLESVTPSTSTKLALSAELLMLKINQSAYPESALDPSSARDTCMNAVANDLIGQSNATTTTTTPGPDREDLSQFSRLTSASEREEYPLYSRLGSTDDQRLTRGNSVDDWRHNYDILMLSQRSSANDGQFLFSRQGSVNNDSQFLNSRANSSSNYNNELFHLPRQTSIDERIYPQTQNPSDAHSNSPTLKREHSLNFGSVVSPRMRSSGTSTNTPSNPYTPSSRIIERDKMKDKDKEKDKDKDGKDRDKDRDKEKEGREREREKDKEKDKEKDRDRDRAKGKSPSSINTDTGSIRKRSMSTLPPLSPTFDFGSRYVNAHMA